MVTIQLGLLSFPTSTESFIEASHQTSVSSTRHIIIIIVIVIIIIMSVFFHFLLHVETYIKSYKLTKFSATSCYVVDMRPIELKIGLNPFPPTLSY